MVDKEKSNVDCMKVDYVKITNDDFFTADRILNWRVFISQCCLEVCENIMDKVDPVNGIEYFVSESLLYEVVGDAIIGMSKIIDKTPHPIEHPNAFKIAAYLGYWFLRHKPVSLIYPAYTDLNVVTVAQNVKIDSKYLSWQLKHINEMVAVSIVTTFIFDFDVEICDKKQCKLIKKQNMCNGKSAFEFDDFEHQKKILFQKLAYYFAYRAIAPKVIEHILEGYAFHPAWALTGLHWDTNATDSDEQLIIDIMEK